MDEKIINVMDYEQWQKEHKRRKRAKWREFLKLFSVSRESLKLFCVLMLFSVGLLAFGIITWLFQIFY